MRFSDPTRMKGFIDLFDRQDDQTVLRNPHKGWYVHFVDNGFIRPFYRDSIPKGDHLEKVPGINHLYIRFDWCDIEKEEGVFDWSPIDSIIEEWAPHGLTFSLRFCTYEANNRLFYDFIDKDHCDSATPAWVFDAGAAYHRIQSEVLNGIEPIYDDPVYLEKLENFMRAYGAHYNGHPSIEFIDIGSFGTWGEGHTSSGSCTKYSADTVKKHMELHARYFPDTVILVNDDMIRHSGEQYEEELVKYCRDMGFGWRDDSVLVKGIIPEAHYHSFRDRAYNMIPSFYDYAPVDIESGHQRYLSDEHTKGGYVFYHALEESHATYAGFHGAVYDWYEKNRYMHDRIANKLGYWYFTEGIRLPEMRTGRTVYADLAVSNQGFAPAYHAYRLIFTLLGKEGRYTVHSSVGCNLAWQPGKTSLSRIALDLRAIPAGEYELCISMESENGREVRFGIKEEYAREGVWALTKVRVSDGTKDF